MAEYPARRGQIPPADEAGRESPMPAEYGSLTAYKPPPVEAPVDEWPEPAAPARPVSGTLTAGPALRSELDVEAPEPEPATSTEARPQPAPRPTTSSRQTIRHLDVWTVARVSIVFYLLVLVAVVFASIMLWYLADAFGALQSIEKSARSLFSLKSFKVHPLAVAMYTSLGGVVLAITGTLANILAALMYNLISDLVGGVRVTVVERERSRPLDS